MSILGNIENAIGNEAKAVGSAIEGAVTAVADKVTDAREALGGTPLVDQLPKKTVDNLLAVTGASEAADRLPKAAPSLVADAKQDLEINLKSIDAGKGPPDALHGNDVNGFNSFGLASQALAMAAMDNKGGEYSKETPKYEQALQALAGDPALQQFKQLVVVEQEYSAAAVKTVDPKGFAHDNPTTNKLSEEALALANKIGAEAQAGEIKAVTGHDGALNTPSQAGAAQVQARG
jgi:hypothetical protein